MDYREQIVADLAEAACTSICRRAIRALQGVTDAVLSGDDSGLVNAWDEVCVQVQGELSFFWEHYLETIEATIRPDIEALPKHVAQAIWLQTPRGMDWVLDGDADRELVIDREDIVEHVLSCVWSAADDWSNARIREYLGR